MRKPAEIARRLLILVLLSGVFCAQALAAAPAQPAASTADSLPGTIVHCVDFRTREPLLIHGQQILADGTIPTSSSLLADRLCVGVAQEVSSVSIGDGASGSLVVWVDNSDELGDIYAQHVLPGGVIAPGWPTDGVPVCVAPGSQYQPTVATDGHGGLIAAWVDFRDASSGRIYAQHVSAAGQTTWAANGIPVSSSPSAQSGPGISSDGAGGCLIVWTDMRSGEGDLYATRLGANGVVAGGALPEGSLIVGAPGSQAMAHLVQTSAGALVVWEDARAGSLAVFAAAVASDGTAAPGWPVGGVPLGHGIGNQFMSVIAPDGADGCLVAWTEVGTGYAHVKVQRLGAATSTPRWNPDGVQLSDSPDQQFGPALVGDGSGGVIVGWEQAPAGGTADIYAQHVDATGARTWGANGSAVCRASGQQSNVSLASDGAGGALATWVDATTQGRAAFARARPVDPGPAPVLSTVESGPGRAKLSWQCLAGDSRNLDLMRQAEGEDWRPLVTLKPNEKGELTHEDRTVRSGTTVLYRLALHRGGDEVLFPTIVVAIPLPKPLALRFVRHDRSGQVLTLGMTLETNDPASMEVIDVQGRRVANRSLGAPGAGDHELPIALPMRLPSGMYFVRLIQGRGIRTARLAVVK